MSPSLFHESVHAAWDARHRQSPEWLAAQASDGAFITAYAAKKPDGEDLAESALFAYTLLHHLAERRCRPPERADVVGARVRRRCARHLRDLRRRRRGALAALQVEQADLSGFSNGANVALQVAIRHPELVRKLVFASSITKHDGARPELWAHIDRAQFANMPQPLKDEFLSVNPDPRALERMHGKDAARMRSFHDVPDDALRAVRAPTLIVTGDRDIVKPTRARRDEVRENEQDSGCSTR